MGKEQKKKRMNIKKDWHHSMSSFTYRERESAPCECPTVLRLSTHEPRERRVSGDPTKPSENNKKRKKESAGQITVYVRCLSLFIIIIKPIGII